MSEYKQLARSEWLTESDWLDNLKQNEKAIARLNAILNRTPTSEDGETVFATVEDAMEVYTILFTAWSGGKESLDTLTEYMESHEDRAITHASIKNITERKGDEFFVEDAKVEGVPILMARTT